MLLSLDFPRGTMRFSNGEVLEPSGIQPGRWMLEDFRSETFVFDDLNCLNVLNGLNSSHRSSLVPSTYRGSAIR